VWARYEVRARVSRCCEFEVRDDGRGGAAVARGTGLLGLKDRMEALGGRIFLDSQPEVGTTLRVEFRSPPRTAGCIPLDASGRQRRAPFQLLMRNPPSARDEYRLFKPRIEGSGIMHFALFRTCE
jgi:hypothetical protein